MTAPDASREKRAAQVIKNGTRGCGDPGDAADAPDAPDAADGERPGTMKKNGTAELLAMRFYFFRRAPKETILDGRINHQALSRAQCFMPSLRSPSSKNTCNLYIHCTTN